MLAQKGAPGHETNQQIGKSRDGNSTKLHAVVDGLGNPVYLQLSAGNFNDSTLAIDVLSHVKLSGAMCWMTRHMGLWQSENTLLQGGNLHHTVKIKYHKPMGM